MVEAPVAPEPPKFEVEPLSRDVYPLIIEAMVSLLRDPQTDQQLAAAMCVRAPQVKDWLARGVHEGRIKKLNKPMRYTANVPTLFGD